MATDPSTDWWRDASVRFGFTVMEKTLGEQDGRDALLASGHNDLCRALTVTGMRTGKELTCLEIGCGTGRVTFALAGRFGFVVGMDVSQGLLDRAAAMSECDNVVFERCDGSHIRPQSRSEFDTVFSCEVFHHVEGTTLASFARDAYALLPAGGQFVFQVNVTPRRFATKVARLIRRILNFCGKARWRGFPTAAGFARKHHTVPFIRRCLTDAGFRVERVLDEAPAQTWFVAAKPHAASN